jgi:hypothetical protein
MVAAHSFEDACMQGDQTALRWQALDTGGNTMFRRWSLRDLRARGITPLE